MRLTAEKLESIVLSEDDIPDDLDADQRERVEQARLIRRRLARAFEGVHAPDLLRGRIQQGEWDAGRAREVPDEPVSARRRPWALRLLAPLAAVAAVAAVAVLVLWNGSAGAAQQAVAECHLAMTQRARGWVADGDANHVQEHLAAQTGIRPIIIRASDANLLGCMPGTFRGVSLAAYLVRVPEGEVSIVIIAAPADSLSMPAMAGESGYWACQQDDCRMVARRIGKYTYVAAGQVGHGVLKRLLEGL